MFYRHYSIKMGGDLPINVYGSGLKINHFGLIMVNDNARIGALCDIHQSVNIDQQGDLPDDGSTIDDHCIDSLDAMPLGRIHIADECTIGANAVVNKDFLECDIIIVGIPVQKILDRRNSWIRHLNNNPHDS